MFLTTGPRGPPREVQGSRPELLESPGQSSAPVPLDAGASGSKPQALPSRAPGHDPGLSGPCSLLGFICSQWVEKAVRILFNLPAEKGQRSQKRCFSICMGISTSS